MASIKNPTIEFKNGDDFKLDLTVQDTNNTTAIAASVALQAAQATYDAAIAADPQVQQDIDDAEILVTSTQAAYDAAIIVDITGWVITSQMRWCGKLITSFTVTIIDAEAGTFTLTVGGIVTQEWKPRVYDVDIEFARPEGKTSSQTFHIDVEAGVTNA